MAAAAGTHPEFSRKSDALQRVRDRRVFAAERFKQMQIDNIQGLYEYEVLEAEAAYKVGGWVLGEREEREGQINTHKHTFQTRIDSNTY